MSEEKEATTTIPDDNAIKEVSPNLDSSSPPPLPRRTVEPYYKNRPKEEDYKEEKKYVYVEQQDEYYIENLGPSFKTAFGLWVVLAGAVVIYNYNSILLIPITVICVILFIILLIFGKP